MRRSTETLLLVDADWVTYLYAAGGEKDCGFGIDLAPFEDVAASAKAWLKALSKKFDGTILLCYSCAKHNFRKDVLPSYKANRVGKAKPQHYWPLKAELIKHYKVYERENLEGDDVMGILATWPLLSGRKIIVSIDKDMTQIPGELYNPGKDTLVKISKLQGLRYHMTQTLTGDAVDGYKGCLGCGPVGAKKALANLRTVEEMWPAVVQQYYNALIDTTEQAETVALAQARVAKILQCEDYNFQTKEPILWTPPKA